MTRAIFWTLLPCALLACGDKSDTDDTSHDHESDTDTDTDADTDTDTDADADKAGFDGVVSFDDGTDANGGVRMQMCNTETCIPAFATTGGAFSFPGLGVDTYSLDAVPLVGDDPPREYATPLDIYVIDGEDIGSTITLPDPIVIYSWQKVSALATGPFTVGDLTIQANTATFTPEKSSEADFLAGVQVDPATAGLPLALLPADGIAMMWYLGPFRARVDGWSFSVANTGLPEGTLLRAYNAYYSGFEWVDLGTLTVNAEGTAVPDAGTGLQHLSTLVLVIESR